MRLETTVSSSFSGPCHCLILWSKSDIAVGFALCVLTGYVQLCRTGGRPRAHFQACLVPACVCVTFLLFAVAELTPRNLIPGGIYLTGTSTESRARYMTPLPVWRTALFSPREE